MSRAGTFDAAPAWFRWITRASLGLGVIALAITVWAVGVDTLVDHLHTIGLWFAVLLAIEAAATCCDAASVYWMSRGPGAPSFRMVCVAQFAGGAVNSVTPGANLGEALKVSLLARTCSTQRIIAAVMYVALASFVVLFGVIAAGSIATAILFPLPAVAVIALLAAGVAAAAVSIAIVVMVRRGMLSSLSRAAQRLHLISRARGTRWADRLADLDARLRGDIGAEHRVAAASWVLVSQVLKRGIVWVTIIATGYELGVPQLIAVLSAGVILNWISTIIPMGLGVSEGGNGIMFALIGAPSSLGVALALARRVNQIVFAAVGFGVLAADRIAHRLDALEPPMVAGPRTARHAAVAR